MRTLGWAPHRHRIRLDSTEYVLGSGGAKSCACADELGCSRRLLEAFEEQLFHG
jgi:hypothetical protein